jgi:hypothetical protein
MRENRRLKFSHERHGALVRSAEARGFEARHHRLEESLEHSRARSRATEERYDERHEHIGFDALVKKVEHEYRAKGYTKAEAHAYAVATAGKQWHRQHLYAVHREHPLY